LSSNAEAVRRRPAGRWPNLPVELVSAATCMRAAAVIRRKKHLEDGPLPDVQRLNRASGPLHSARSRGEGPQCPNLPSSRPYRTPTGCTGHPGPRPRVGLGNAYRKQAPTVCVRSVRPLSYPREDRCLVRNPRRPPFEHPLTPPPAPHRCPARRAWEVRRVIPPSLPVRSGARRGGECGDDFVPFPTRCVKTRRHTAR